MIYYLLHMGTQSKANAGDAHREYGCSGAPCVLVTLLLPESSDRSVRDAARSDNIMAYGQLLHLRMHQMWSQ
jgi:hypothetical protein